MRRVEQTRLQASLPPGPTAAAQPSLAALKLLSALERNSDKITATWAAKSAALPRSHYRLQPRDLLIRWGREILSAIGRYLRTGSHKVLDDELTNMTAERLRRGFDIGEVQEAFLLLKEVALPFICEDPEGVQEAITELDLCMRYMVSRFGHQYSEAIRRDLEAQHRRIALMLDMAQTASSSLQLEEVLTKVANGMAAAVGARHCGIYLYDAVRNVLVPHAGIGTDSLEQGEEFLRLELDPVKEPLIRELIERKRPAVCADVQNDPCVSWETARLMGVKSVLAVPLAMSDRMVGAALISTFVSQRTFTYEEIELAQGIASATALAIENARLFRKAEETAVMEERARLARELHDSVTQSIYSITLYAEAAHTMLQAGEGNVALEHLRELQETAREALAEMRLLVFELRPPLLEKEGLVDALEARLDTVEARAGFKTELRIEGERELPFATAEQLYHIVQEALNNVIKHARAQNVKVRLKFGADYVMLEVTDDGVGFVRIGVPEKGGLGLRGMEERVQRVGGKLDIQSNPGQGTCVRVTLKL